MEYTERAYFIENEEPDVKGFTIIDTNDGDYHIAEKWNKPDGGETWLQYWIPEQNLLVRIEEGKCEMKAELTDEQYETVCSMISFDSVTSEVTI